MYERVGFFAAPLEVPRRTKLYFETDQSQKPELCHPGQDPRFQMFEEEIAEIWNYAEIFAHLCTRFAFVITVSVWNPHWSVVRNQPMLNPAEMCSFARSFQRVSKYSTGGSPVREALRATCPRWKEAPK